MQTFASIKYYLNAKPWRARVASGVPGDQQRVGCVHQLCPRSRTTSSAGPCRRFPFVRSRLTADLGASGHPYYRGVPAVRYCIFHPQALERHDIISIAELRRCQCLRQPHGRVGVAFTFRSASSPLHRRAHSRTLLTAWCLVMWSLICRSIARLSHSCARGRACRSQAASAWSGHAKCAPAVGLPAAGCIQGEQSRVVPKWNLRPR